MDRRAREGATRLRAFSLATRQQLWERELPGDCEFYQAETGGRVGVLALGAMGPLFRWLDEDPGDLPGPPAVPLGLALEIPRARGCDVVAPRTDDEAALVEAQRRYQARDWAGVHAALRDLRSRPEHADHLDGAASLLSGDLAQAEHSLVRFTRVPAATCELGGVLSLAPSRFKLGRPEVRGDDPNLSVALAVHVTAVRLADAALARGDGPAPNSRSPPFPAGTATTPSSLRVA